MSYLKGKNKPQGGAIGQHRARRSRRPVCRNLNFRAAAGTRLLPEVIAAQWNVDAVAPLQGAAGYSFSVGLRFAYPTLTNRAPSGRQSAAAASALFDFGEEASNAISTGTGQFAGQAAKMSNTFGGSVGTMVAN